MKQPNFNSNEACMGLEENRKGHHRFEPFNAKEGAYSCVHVSLYSSHLGVSSVVGDGW